MAFTLIEMLVVIAIISILASLMMPALGTARNVAQSTSCMNNMKNILVGAALYANDNNGYILPAEAGISGGGWTRWADADNGDMRRALINPYVKVPDILETNVLIRKSTGLVRKNLFPKRESVIL